MSSQFFDQFLRELARRIFPRYTLSGTENLPEGPYIFVGNHAQTHGPVVSQLYLPGKNYCWCAGEMFRVKDVPAYARKDFWGGKPKWSQPFFYVLSYLIAPLCAYVFTHADTIPVYRDTRVVHTMKETVEKLGEADTHVVIFPEGHQSHNTIVAEFQQGYADVAKIYRRKTGEELAFVPMYIAPSLGKVCFGTPVYSQKEEDRAEAGERISRELMDKITELAVEQPLHRVTPYENIAKKNYPLNRI